jgi:ketosteroid isomerase-like protein
MTESTRRSLGLFGASFLGLAGAAGIATSLQARNQTADEATRRAVIEVKQGILAGHKARDRAALDRLYADDYTAIDAKGGITTKSELLAGLAAGAEIVEGRYEIVTVRRWGDVAVASGHGHLVYRNPDGSTRVSDYDSVNVFERRDGRWYYAAAFLP